MLPPPEKVLTELAADYGFGKDTILRDRQRVKEACLAQCRFMLKEHCATKGEARGMELCIGAIEKMPLYDFVPG